MERGRDIRRQNYSSSASARPSHGNGERGGAVHQVCFLGVAVCSCYAVDCDVC